MKRISIYLKLRVIGAIDSMPGNSRVSRIKEVAKLTFHDEEGVPHVFTWRTIQTWFSVYQKGGVEALRSRPRADKGRHRKVSPEDLREAIEAVLPEFHEQRFNKMMIYRRCIERGLINHSECSQTSFFRLVRTYDLLTPPTQTSNKRRLAFSKQYANQMWQLDTMVGPYITHTQRKVQTRLICFIDDASRIIAHGQFFASEKTEDLIVALRAALFKRGIPETLYVDNGAIYTCAEINQICGRIGCLLCHTPVRDGAAKGKIERFFRTVRDQFLLRELDLSSLEVLNDQFHHWVEQEYNTRVHSTLQMKPVDRFGMDLDRIRFLEPGEAGEELFFFEQNRTVRKDNTFQVLGKRYECPVDLADRTIQVRFNRAQPGDILVYYQNERLGKARELNYLHNDRPSSESRPQAQVKTNPKKGNTL